MDNLDELIARLRELLAKATPGPYRAHDHNDMALVGADPSDWMGWAWIGRIGKQSGPNGEFDAGWFDSDRRKDGCKEYKENASTDAHLVAAALNALPTLLDAMTALKAERDALAKALNKLSDCLDRDMLNRIPLYVLSQVEAAIQQKDRADG